MEPRPAVLCVDDETVNSALIEALLVPRGYDVLKASSGRDALAVLSERRVDLVLLDVMMPGLDGFEVCRLIKGAEETRHIPVILLTALSGREDRIRGIESGADDFITKPFDKGEVLARVKMLLKVKSLDERLGSAYGHIVSLMETAGRLIRAFDPLTFDFASSVDAFVAPILRRGEGDRERPRTAVVGFPHGSAGAWRWWRYRSGEEGSQRAEVPLLLAPGADEAGPRLLFFNESDMNGAGCAWLGRALAPAGLKPSNAVCWLSPELCVFLLDYGRQVTAYDTTVLAGFVTQSLFLRSLAEQVRETENAFSYTVASLARAAEANDEDTGNHIQRVGEYCALLAEHLGMSYEFMRAIHLQAQMHDVGKIHVHPDILKKTGELTPDEWSEMQKHTLYGAMIIGDHPRLALARNMALSHHEKWDGSGYPFGLKGEDIPLEGRIIGIADQYDALRSKRFYKAPMDHAAAVRILLEGGDRTSPAHFDPRVLDAFQANHEKFAVVYERLSS